MNRLSTEYKWDQSGGVPTCRSCANSGLRALSYAGNLSQLLLSECEFRAEVCVQLGLQIQVNRQVLYV